MIFVIGGTTIVLVVASRLIIYQHLFPLFCYTFKSSLQVNQSKEKHGKERSFAENHAPNIYHSFENTTSREVRSTISPK